MTITTNVSWVDVDVEVIHETTKAVLVDFGADHGCTHRAWIPKSHFREIAQGNFNVQQITRKWMGMKGLWNWAGR